MSVSQGKMRATSPENQKKKEEKRAKTSKHLSEAAWFLCGSCTRGCIRIVDGRACWKRTPHTQPIAEQSNGAHLLAKMNSTCFVLLFGASTVSQHIPFRSRILLRRLFFASCVWATIKFIICCVNTCKYSLIYVFHTVPFCKQLCKQWKATRKKKWK